MAPSTAQISSQLRQIVWYHLDNDLVDNALFFAGRLHAVEPRNPDSVHILALCHLRAGQFKAAFEQSRLLVLRREHLGCYYVFAQSCLGLGKYTEGISAIERIRSLWDGRGVPNKAPASSRRSSPDASAFLSLLGKLCHAAGDVKKAADNYVAALKLNPFMWDAYERLCDTGTQFRPAQIFKESHVSPAFLAALDSGVPGSQGNMLALPQQALQSNASSFGSEPSVFSKQPADTGLTLGEVNLLAKPNSRQHQMSNSSGDSGLETTPATVRADEGNTLVAKEIRPPSRPSSIEPPNAPLRKTRTHATSLMSTQSGADIAKLRPMASKSRLMQHGTDVAEAPEPHRSSAQPGHLNKRTASGGPAQSMASTSLDPAAAPQRRSVRLKKTPGSFGIPVPRDAQDAKRAKATGTRGRTAAVSTVGRVVSGNRKALEPPAGFLGKEPRTHASIRAEPMHAALKPVLETSSHDGESIPWLLELLARLAQGYYSSSQFDCQQALQVFQGIPAQQRETPWVLAQIGKAHYEQNEHAAAEKVFARIRKLAPWMTKDMEIYSTLLWHLKSDLELAFLSHELVEANRMSPEAWCTIGNSFSLQREHEQALKCFKRATQLEPSFAYAYTLQGHEHISNEDYDKALTAYRKAIGANRRHYNGWYGIGRVYEKLGKYEMAEKHYRAAAAINPGNAILVCHIGTVLDKQGEHRAALAEYNRACELAPKAAMSRFKRARTLLRLRKYEGALEEFLVLKDMAPDEANVHFMLGKTYRMLNDRANAIKHLTTALNLDPKAGPLIKGYMEAMGEISMSDDEDEDEEGID